MLFNVWVISSVVIFVLTYSIMEVKFAILPSELRMAITRSFDIGLVIKSFIPVINILMLIGAIAFTKQDWFR